MRNRFGSNSFSDDNTLAIFEIDNNNFNLGEEKVVWRLK
uniref:Uncharacterized protein n=1 Tax=Carnobacterium maltaromaticum TaxID=2751 RepID=A0A1Z5AWW0_CARML|nr:protein of unknown function [Carnobacterium maltaromaticum]